MVNRSVQSSPVDAPYFHAEMYSDWNQFLTTLFWVKGCQHQTRTDGMGMGPLMEWGWTHWYDGDNGPTDGMGMDTLVGAH